MAAYYNEFDPKAAAWLRELIKQGHIADGVVDERSIEDVTPTELAGFTQCHFFAGIGVWSYALRRAGWADDRPVWTGSCPCQPFSAAGKGAGFADERHLWPAFHHLISQCQPAIVVGEQVASKDGLAWLDLVCADLEATGYAIGAVDLCAAGVGAPHIRQRLWWVGVADTVSPRLQGRERSGPTGTQGRSSGYSSECSGLGGLADTTILGRGEGVTHDGWMRGGDSAEGAAGRSAVYGDLGNGLADSDSASKGMVRNGGVKLDRRDTRDARFGLGSSSGDEWMADTSGIRRGAGGVWDNSGNDGNQPDADVKDDRPSATNGHWRDADWLFCRDGKWRPVEPGTSPLAYGSAARVGRLRGYGNAIVAQAAQAFIESVM